MHISATRPSPVAVPVQRTPVSAPKDADGDHDGSTSRTNASAKSPAVVSGGKVDTYA
jgi:hypothetical protein